METLWDINYCEFSRDMEEMCAMPRAVDTALRQIIRVVAKIAINILEFQLNKTSKREYVRDERWIQFNFFVPDKATKHCT